MARGGYRPGAGRKPNGTVKMTIAVPKEHVAPSPKVAEPKINKVDVSVSDCLKHKDPKVFLLALMNDYEADIKLRAEAAKALMPFMHGKLGENTTKQDREQAAKKAATGKFGAAPPPLRVVNGG